MSRQITHRTDEGTMIVPGVDYQYQHEYQFKDGRLMHRYVRPDGTPHPDQNGQWEYLSDKQVVDRYYLHIPELNQLLAENGITREAERQARPKSGRPRRR